MFVFVCLYSINTKSICLFWFLNDFQVFRKVGGALEDRVIKWFDYLWQNKVEPAPHLKYMKPYILKVKKSADSTFQFQKICGKGA